ncbi:hypothetical protein HC251_07970 [Iamia sp. SCSIO 61187]|uniref:hypothetical protein n=1 Tax=Iamia sp. SCSIO 61187 TaxID=2722752 RepID=UPI001C62E585|nr:hypothetical protein [Iamia sp. SCSIO 61187]QYG92384.1 hypothetical protein HC251_07970 [Iamia sp. SCSIO 61187]
MPDLSLPTLTVVSWRDPVIDALGYVPTSTYVERYWLSILGPSTTWLVRHLDQRLVEEPDGATVDLDATAAALGLGAGRGRHSPLVRALHRCCQFGLARAVPDAHLAVRRHLPPLTRHQIDRLPPSIRASHHRWTATERDAGVLDAHRRRARHLALGLAELGEDVATTTQRLVRFEIHPIVAEEAAQWAHRLVRARTEADAAPALPGAVAPAPPTGAAAPPPPAAVADLAARRTAPPPPPARAPGGTSDHSGRSERSDQSDDAA